MWLNLTQERSIMVGQAFASWKVLIACV